MRSSLIWVLFKRELASYFATPIAYVFIVIFLFLSGIFTFYLGNFFARNQADLLPFFNFHPWLYLFLIPALSMRLWAEERKSGSIELLLTLPISVTEAVLGKFFAAWVFTGIALFLTFPMWITVNYLGDPDNAVIFAGYLGSLLMAGGFLAIGSCISTLTKNQVIAFVLSLMVSLGFLLLGFAPVVSALQQFLPGSVADALISMSFLTHFQAIIRGVLDVRDVGFFVVFIATWLLATVAVVEWKRAE